MKPILILVIEESMYGTKTRTDPWYALSPFGNLSYMDILYYYTGLCYKLRHTHTDLVGKSFKSPGLDLNQRSLPYQDNALPN